MRGGLVSACALETLGPEGLVSESSFATLVARVAGMPDCGLVVKECAPVVKKSVL